MRQMSVEIYVVVTYWKTNSLIFSLSILACEIIVFIIIYKLLHPVSLMLVRANYIGISVNCLGIF